MTLIAALLLVAAPPVDLLPPEAFREVLCSVPYSPEVIPLDDPARVLFEGEGESPADVGVRIAIERANSCDDPQERGEFACDDDPQGDPEGCLDAILVDRKEWEAIEFRLCGENGSVSRDDQGPVCDRWEEPQDDCPIDDVGGFERCEARRR
jgi:hypothetical protein